MTFQEIRATIEGLLHDWAGVPIAWDNVPAGAAVTAAQNAGDPWVRLTLIPGTTEPAGKADTPKVRRTGLISIQVFTARNVGSDTAYSICDSLSDHLQHRIIGHLETLALSVTRAGIVDDYYQLNAQTPYRAG